MCLTYVKYLDFMTVGKLVYSIFISLNFKMLSNSKILLTERKLNILKTIRATEKIFYLYA